MRCRNLLSIWSNLILNKKINITSYCKFLWWCKLFLKILFLLMTEIYPAYWVLNLTVNSYSIFGSYQGLKFYCIYIYRQFYYIYIDSFTINMKNLLWKRQFDYKNEGLQYLTVLLWILEYYFKYEHYIMKNIILL